MQRIAAVFLVICIGLAFSAIPTQAKGIPDYYVLTGPDIAPVTFTLDLDTALLFDPQARLDSPPTIATDPYILRSYAHTDRGEMVEFMLSPVHYYPAEGLIYFVGAQDRGISQEFDGKWYPVTNDAAQAINRHLSIGHVLQTLRLWVR